MTDIYAAEQSDSIPADQVVVDRAPTPISAQPWHDKLKAYQSAIEDKWQGQRDNLDKLYSRDERADVADREYSIFWANIEVLKEAAYARPPVPVVAPRFKGKNLVARAASDILERCLVTTFEQADLDGCLREVRDELLRYARGTARVRYAEGDRLVFDYFTAADFAHDPARSWREVKWVAFRAWLTKDAGKARFDEPLARFGRTFDEVPRKKRDPNAAVNQKDDQAPVWEIWCLESRKVHFVSEDFDIELDTQEPWLDLTGFWPCPRPAYGTLVPGKLKPVPDIRQYKDQIEEINEYTSRIAALSESLRLKGFYPAGAGEISEAIEAAIKAVDNRSVLVPISSWAQLGGVAPRDMIIWLPVRDVLELVKGLVELRRVVIDDVYQITGIADILRGQTQASETATAQQLKSQWGSLRIRGRQGELARFARDLTRIAGEVIAENFQPQTIAQMAQTELPSQADKLRAQLAMQQMQQRAQMAQQQGMSAPPMPPLPEELRHALERPSFEEVIAFLHNDKARGFVIEIETDSTIQPDEDAEKQRRIEFVEAIGAIFRQAAPIVMQAPQLGPFMGEVLKFTAQGFRAGRPLQGALDELVEQLKAAAARPQAPPRPDPGAEAEQKVAAMKLQGVHAATQATLAKANANIAEARMRMTERAQDHALGARERLDEAALATTGDQAVN